jgi:hypothetical protein
MRLLWVALALVVGCDDSDGPSVVADVGLDSAEALDAPVYQCRPPDPIAPGPTCLALETGGFTGTSPLGIHETYLANVFAGDCITISQASFVFTGACGELVRLQFSYPVMAGANSKRFIAPGGFDRDARLELEALDRAIASTVAKVHVDVTSWQEGDGVHDIDITITFPDAGYAIAPVHVKGTFCDWAYHLC